MPKAVSLFTLAAAAIVLSWWWLGKAVPMPPSPLQAGEKLQCVSYAPFRGAQSPLDLSTRIEPSQIDEDLKLLAQITGCVRTYSVDFGLENVPEIARRHGLKVLLGMWVSSHADRTKLQIDTGVELAKRFPDTIEAVVVGNEALLRGEVSPQALATLIRDVKKRVPVRVTYADVWEFWLRYRQSIEGAVDFITVHILPYWEDEPIGARHAADHIASIRRKVASEFPGKEILIGEVGWPSAGRMREGALPSLSSQARVMHDLMVRAKQEGFRFNVIEAFDQPWKRYQEGTVGGHWGLITDPPRERKFVWGEAVSDHPHWRWQALGGVAFAAVVFAAAMLAQRRRVVPEPSRATWMLVAVIAAVAGVMLPWAAVAAALESLGLGGWARSLAFLIIGAGASLAAAAALVLRVPLPSFASLLGPLAGRTGDPLQRLLGWLLIALTVLSAHSALGLAFNPRYLDFPFAPLTASVVPLLLLAVALPAMPATRRAEAVAAVLLVLCSIYVAWNETLANWQAIWFCGALLLLAFTLARGRAARG